MTTSFYTHNHASSFFFFFFFFSRLFSGFSVPSSLCLRFVSLPSSPFLLVFFACSSPYSSRLSLASSFFDLLVIFLCFSDFRLFFSGFLKPGFTKTAEALPVSGSSNDPNNARNAPSSLRPLTRKYTESFKPITWDGSFLLVHTPSGSLGARSARTSPAVMATLMKPRTSSPMYPSAILLTTPISRAPTRGLKIVNVADTERRISGKYGWTKPLLDKTRSSSYASTTPWKS